MKIDSSVTFSDRQRLLKLVLGLASFIAASLGFSSYIHEFGHVFFAYLVGGSGHIINTHLSQVYVSQGIPYYVATMGGVWFESAFWLILYRVSWSKPWRSLPLMFALAAPFYGLLGSVLGLEFNSYSIPDNVQIGSMLFFFSSFLWWGIWFWLLFKRIVKGLVMQTASYYEKRSPKNSKYDSPLSR